MIDDVTAVLVTLDEEQNVEACIETIRAAGVESVLVIDASSTDRTAERARGSGAKVHVVPRMGLAYQRQYGVDRVRTPFVLMADADNRFRAETVQLLRDDLVSSGMAGVAPRKVAKEPSSYWARAWSWHNDLSYASPGHRLVIGTPALYWTHVLQDVRYDPAMTGASDDTDLCLRLSLAGWQVGVGSAVCDELVRVGFRQFARKTMWYGRGDAQFFFKHPDRRRSIATHPIRNYLLRGSWGAIRKGRPGFVAFYALYAVLRSLGFLRALLFLATRKRLPIYRT